MTKKIFEEYSRGFSVILKGDYATHSVLGEPANFYVYVKDNWEPWSKWIKGNSGLFYELKKLHSKKNLTGFVEMVENTWTANKK